MLLTELNSHATCNRFSRSILSHKQNELVLGYFQPVTGIDARSKQNVVLIIVK